MVNLENKVSVYIYNRLKEASNLNFAKSRNKVLGDNYNSLGVATRAIRNIVKETYKENPTLKNPYL